MLILGPFLMLGITIGAGYLGASSGANSSNIAVISSQSTLRKNFLKSNSDDIDTKVTDEKAAAKKMKDDKLAGYVVFNTDNKQVTARYVGTTSMSSSMKTRVNSFLSQTQQQLNMAQAKLSSQQLQALQQQPKLTEKIQEKRELPI
jgi:ABC-type Na+ efflux pump, permease component